MLCHLIFLYKVCVLLNTSSSIPDFFTEVKSIQIDMSPIPTIPNGNVADVVCPSYCEKIQCVLIVNLEAVLFNFGAGIAIAGQPLGEFFFSVIISYCYDINCCVAFI
jgi:hypothetical protein